ncbi:MAG: hypothetical protein ACREJM_01180, partial [Candidatus Saccharimonadales bacterium]
MGFDRFLLPEVSTQTGLLRYLMQVEEIVLVIYVSLRPRIGQGVTPEEITGICWILLDRATVTVVSETAEALERRIDQLRVAVRQAVLAGDR